MSTTLEKFEQANQHFAAGWIGEAVRLYQEVLQVEPGHAEACHRLGCIALGHGKPEAAEPYLVRAIRLDGGRAPYHNDLGECYRTLDKLAEAEASFRQAIRLQGEFALPRVNLSLTLYAQSRTTEADECAAAALRLPCATVEEHCACAALRLLRGDFEGGWAEHEWRLEMPGTARPTPPGARWDGRSLAGEHILLWSEQGLGDTLQFVRYTASVIARGGRPTLWVPKNLIPLVSEAELCELAPLEEPAPACEFHCPLLSLPHRFGTTLATIPKDVPYLRANEELVSLWRERLAGVAGFRVGICWQGNPLQARDRTRSVPLRAFGALAGIPGVRLISLQRHTGLEQRAAIATHFELLELGADYDVASGAFMDTAAVMSSLDLVITTDTAIAHLAGALGVPVWVALSIVPDWRWMLDRDDSPWYPTMRLLRQRRAGDWEELMSRMAEALRVEVAARSRPRRAP